MPPQPTHPSARLRRNKTTTQALIVANPNAQIPTMPARTRMVELRNPETGKRVLDEYGQTELMEIDAEWAPHVVETWAEVWRSGMVVEYTDADLGLLRSLMFIEQEVHERATLGKPLAQAIESAAKVRKELGLTPMGRRSLEWMTEATGEIAARNARASRKPSDADSSAEEVPPLADTVEDHEAELGSLYE